jgi:alpha-L-fucosidase 2
MRLASLSALLLLLRLLHAGEARGASPSGRPALDLAPLAAYFSTIDMLWSWNATGGGPLDPLAPTLWSSGAYVGNGVVGAIATAVVNATSNATTALRLDVGRTDVWGDCQQRLPVGYLTIALAPGMGELARVDMRVDVFRAQLLLNLTAVGAGEGGGGDHGGALPLGRRSSATTPRVVGLRVTVNADGEGNAATPGVLVVSSPPSSLLNTSLADVTIAWTDDTSGACPSSVTTGEAPPPAGGGGAPVAWSTHRTAAGTFSAARTIVAPPASAAFLLAVTNSQRSASNDSASLADALRAMDAAVTASAPALEGASAAWWALFWTNTSFFSFDDAETGGAATRLQQYAHIAG